MWISKAHHADLVGQLTTAQREAWGTATELGALRLRLVALDTTMDWFRVRVTQLEMERATLLQNYLGVTIPTLSIGKAPAAPTHPSYDAVPHFADMGDEEAKRLGVEWNPETGEVVYSQQPE